jgi:periplasmic divalent cation tolerance protein
VLPDDKTSSPDSEEAAAGEAGGVVMIYVTCPDRDTALSIGRDLVEQGLAGCVNVLPAMTSVYVWKGELETAEEAVLIVKLARRGQERAISHILASHPYDTPAVLVLPVEGGSPDYLRWLAEGTRGG